MQQIAVTLLATSNPYVAPTLPARGLLELFELGTNGTLISAVWRALKADGSYGAPVVVDDPAFTYVHPGVEVNHEVAATAALNDLLESFDDVEDLSARAPDMVRAVLAATDGRTARIAST
ncbi:hypothetical protein [Cellulosimicrobium sp. Marseille-Q4280]|uniref:hypothetical protein n=1 Tax=Cellulosimicrobium sp. Marseille-Q4280 TaxID=2937992 RepID=UPI00203F8569|nr:hypothetical protein [Cellulosimicrobium sp. Marseille-Q4280]